MTIEPPRVPPQQSVSRKFAGLARHGTQPEMALRGELHRRGMRYRVQYKVSGLPRRSVDIAFTRVKLAVFVDGCFWHGCPVHCKPPARNPEWWQWKFAKNTARDDDTNARLHALGWAVLRIWEHEDAVEAADHVQRVLRSMTS